MTEVEWRASTEAKEMLDILRGKASSDRKLRLFACACCRRIWHLITDQRSHRAIEIAEHYADGRADRERLILARGEAREAKQQYLPTELAVKRRAANAAQDATRDTGRSAALNCMAETSRAVNDRDTNYCNPAEMHVQAVLLHDIFGNRFRPATLNSAWLTPKVKTLAQAIYD